MNIVLCVVRWLVDTFNQIINFYALSSLFKKSHIDSLSSLINTLIQKSDKLEMISPYLQLYIHFGS